MLCDYWKDLNILWLRMYWLKSLVEISACKIRSAHSVCLENHQLSLELVEIQGIFGGNFVKREHEKKITRKKERSRGL